MKCQNPDCLKQTNNPKYCSNSCAAKVNNRAKPKRLPTNNCRFCNEPIPKSKWYCNESCKQQYNQKNKLVNYVNKHGDKTLQDLINAYNDQNKYVKLRNNAQLIYKYSGNPYYCYNCGYDKHVEICHIQAISSFPLTTKLSIVNDINNLVALCPNCHWELDHGLLTL